MSTEPRTCRTCGGDFVWSDELRRYCSQDCKTKAVRAGKQAWYLRNAQRHRSQQVHRNRRNRYGQTLEERAALLDAQQGRCSICNREMHLDRIGPCQDHDHVTGENRALLCTNCNAGLGQFRDDPDLLLAAATYLLSYRSVLTPEGN